MLAVEHRKQKDPRTLGQVFFLVHEELSDILFGEALQILFATMIIAINEVLFLSRQELNLLVDRFMALLPKTLCSYLRVMDKNALAE